MIPIHVSLKNDRVKWAENQSITLDAPFFHQSIAKYNKSAVHRSTYTNLAALVPNPVPQIPAGLIFHISRCGSTLISNALKVIATTTVISEAQPINALLSFGSSGGRFLGNGVPSRRKILLRAVIDAYARYQPDAALVVKLSSWNLLRIEKIRELYPSVPCAIIVRDPLEVMVSCLNQNPGWMSWKQHAGRAARILDCTRNDVVSMKTEEFGARFIGKFLDQALLSQAQGVPIIDYGSINLSSVLGIAKMFHLQTSPQALEGIRTVFTKYSKSTENLLFDKEDSSAKQAAASEALRQLVARWASTQYSALVNRQNLFI